MKWNRFTIKTKTEAEDVIISALADVGVEGVEIQDKHPLTETDKEQMFVDIMPEGPADDGIAYLNFYLDPIRLFSISTILPSTTMVCCSTVCSTISPL